MNQVDMHTRIGVRFTMVLQQENFHVQTFFCDTLKKWNLVIFTGCKTELVLVNAQKGS